MSKISFFALGGLDENGKNLYIVEIDNDIFVFDCGLKYASGNLLGIDYIIPDFNYLIKHKSKIRGVFLTSGHKENMGGVKDLLEALPNLKIHATKFTKFSLLEDGVNEKNIVEILPHRKINFGENSIFPISVSVNIPDAVMYVINTKDGAICYTGDFIIDPLMNKQFDMDLGRIAYVGKQGVLALLSESTFSEKVGHTSPNHHLFDFFLDVINNNEGRIIFSILPEYIYTIKEIFAALANKHRKVVVMGKKLQNIVDFATKEGYLEYEEELVGDLSNLKERDAIILVADDRANPYAQLNKLLKGYDKFITLEKDDTVVFAEPRFDSSEKLLVRLENELAMYGCKVISTPREKTIRHHASSEDLMLMIKLLNPKYYIPTRGEYRYMVGNANHAHALGIPAENIILKQNGEKITIKDKILTEKVVTTPVDDVLIDGKSSDDVGNLVIKDREMLSESGIVLISATIDKKEKTILVGPEVVTRGFIYIKESFDLISEIKEISQNIIEKHINPKFVDFNSIKFELREQLSKFLYQETESKPMIIAVVQEV